MKRAAIVTYRLINPITRPQVRMVVTSKHDINLVLVQQVLNCILEYQEEQQYTLEDRNTEL